MSVTHPAVVCVRLAKADVVLTTYNIVSKEVGVTEHMKNDKHAHEKPATDSVRLKTLQMNERRKE